VKKAPIFLSFKRVRSFCSGRGGSSGGRRDLVVVIVVVMVVVAVVVVVSEGFMFEVARVIMTKTVAVIATVVVLVVVMLVLVLLLMPLAPCLSPGNPVVDSETHLCSPPSS